MPDPRPILQHGSPSFEYDDDGNKTLRLKWHTSNAATVADALAATPGTAPGSPVPVVPGALPKFGYPQYRCVGGTGRRLSGVRDSDDLHPTWEVSVEYTTAPARPSSSASTPIDPVRGSVSVRPAPVTVQVTRAPSAAVYHPDGAAPPPSYAELLGVRIDPPEIEGIPVQKSAEEIVIKKYFDPADPANVPPHPDVLKALEFHYNAAPWVAYRCPVHGDITYPAGEVLFAGATRARTYQTRETTYLEYEFRFLVSPNASEVVRLYYPDGSGWQEKTVEKLGWWSQWVWSRPVARTVDDALEIEVQPLAVFCNKVYPPGDLTPLNAYLADPVIGLRQPFDSVTGQSVLGEGV